MTHRDTSNVIVFDLLRELIGPLLSAERPDLLVHRFEDFDIASLTFPVHPGALAFRTRNEPGFLERTAGLIDALIASGVALGTAMIALYRFARRRRKSRIDGFYGQLLDVRARIQNGLSPGQGRLALNEVRDIRDNAFRLLMDEKLDPDESFGILQALVNDVLIELGSSDAGPGSPFRGSSSVQVIR